MWCMLYPDCLLPFKIISVLNEVFCIFGELSTDPEYYIVSNFRIIVWNSLVELLKKSSRIHRHLVFVSLVVYSWILFLIRWKWLYKHYDYIFINIMNNYILYNMVTICVLQNVNACFITYVEKILDTFWMSKDLIMLLLVKDSPMKVQVFNTFFLSTIMVDHTFGVGKMLFTLCPLFFRYQKWFIWKYWTHH